jgi:outer membrane protein OmpA-like peptidoglycan-associated protein
MRILITGFIVFVIWSVFATWLYVDKLSAMKEPVTVQAAPGTHTNVADSLALTNEVMPEDLKIYFEFDKVQFTPDPQIDISIADYKTWLEKNPASNLSVTGHTDPVGTPVYNQDLGMKRARAIQNYLVEKGIPSVRIITESKGESQPLGDNLTEEGRAQNRRGEISVKQKTINQ